MNNGIILINKAYGRSSTDEVRILRKLLNQRRVGHTGTLDLLATGLLAVCVGRATKAIEYLQEADKEYVVGIQFGSEKDTIDNEGITVSTTDNKVTLDQLEKAIPAFVGDIEQIPPMHSALRHNGKRLYELARQGIEVDIKSRDVRIESIDIVDFDYDSQYATLRAVVGSGTYIRSLVRDIARSMDNMGYMDSLIRTRCSGYRIEDSISIEYETPPEDVVDAIIPVDNILLNYPTIDVDTDTATRLKNGMTVVTDDTYDIKRYRVVSEGQLLGVSTIGQSEKGTLIKLEKHLYI